LLDAPSFSPAPFFHAKQDFGLSLALPKSSLFSSVAAHQEVWIDPIHAHHQASFLAPDFGRA